MDNVILIIVLVAILGGAVAYIVKAKRSGVKCIGCPSGGSCGQKNGGSCSGCSGGNGCNGCSCGETKPESCDCHTETK